ncbi:F-box domain-containing protein [Colletotrichum musicola]|uniref:F-box domain-containing protein n=1 Tax=Colletotrichum musicola TaxID=2175873 RepID=A0A8H6KTS0_9PEZI|nr:F-box domain-containing protein [Colletotrichum musicola]
MLSFDDVPDEIILQILHYVSPEDNLLCFHPLSRRLNSLANESILWRTYCQHAFKFWHADHRFDDKLEQPASEVLWKQLFLLRKRRLMRTARLFDGILATKHGRVKSFEEICLMGQDAKDFLLNQVETPDVAADVLSRRYFSTAILASIRRGIAISIWDSLRRAEAFESARPDRVPTVVPRRLERALAAFDMFVIQDDVGDVDDVGPPLCARRTSVDELQVSMQLDNITVDFRKDHREFDNLCIREQALTLNRWLRSRNLTGMNNPQVNYRNLRNCLIGHALRDDAHESLPMISSAIFCCIGERLGLNAHCCALPGHVLAMVFATEHTTLDGSKVTDARKPVERMYLDPYGGNEEFGKETLRHFIAQVGWSFDVETMPPAPVSTMIGRLAHNIRQTHLVMASQDVSVERLAGLGHGAALQNLELAVYAAAWATTLLDPRAFVDVTSHFALRFNSLRFDDAWLVEKIYVNRPEPRGDVFLTAPNPEYILRLIRRADEQYPVFREPHNDTEYKIGNVVRHKRYGFMAVVIDGEVPTSGSILYYRLLTPPNMHGTFSLVKASSLELVRDPDEAAASMFPDTGLFFKRFERGDCTFVPSNDEMVYTPL